MATNFPAKYFLLFANSPRDEIHHNNINAGLRIGLTLLMEEYEVYVLLTEEAIWLATSPEDMKQKTLDQFSEKDKFSKTGDQVPEEDDVSFTPYELIEGIISFGGNVMTCRSSLALTGLKEEDIIEGVELIHLHNAIKLMVQCDKAFVF
jgi:predicted peroxiredoxin